MDISRLEENIEGILSSQDKSDFIYDLLDIYGFPKATITLLKKDPSRLSKKDNEVILRNKLVFHVLNDGEDEHLVIDELLHNKGVATHKPRFIIVTDFNVFLAVDTSTKETLDIPFVKLSKYYTFFLPWTGREKYRGESESPADIKAAAKMATLYDQLIAENPYYAKDHAHELNLFLTRLLFCFFAEDSGIFSENLFSGSVISHTAEDGHDLRQYLEELFGVLNIEDAKRVHIPEHLMRFPYVNGGLFEERIVLPDFSKKSRATVVETSKLNWSEINPDIFGSMIQAVTHAGMREDLGMHYTSVSNILKVIDPLFLTSLKDELDKAGENVKRLNELRNRITKIRVFDPACGSGNFLIVSYKKLCEIEIEIINRIQSTGTQVMPLSGISLNNFFGIEIDDFAHEVARLSLWLAQHQMNRHFNDLFGFSKPALPLKEAGNIIQGNATRLDWKDVCPRTDSSGDLEVYVVGNPPYLGSRNQEKKHKEDMAYVFTSDYKILDYITAWFFKGAEYLRGFDKIKVAFVSTNSIAQGSQVSIFWPKIINEESGVEIFFAHQSFKWRNLAKRNAGVSCVIIGLGNTGQAKKVIFDNDQYSEVENINGYLVSGENLYVYSRSKPISNLPPMQYGNYTGACNELLLDTEEKDEILKTVPSIQPYIRKLIGSQELLKGIERYCLWFKDAPLEQIKDLPIIKDKLESIAAARSNSEDEGLKRLAERPHQFRDLNETKATSVVIPIVSSERRAYLPCAFIDKDTIVPNSAHVIYDSNNWIFGILSSKIHMLWIKAVCGSLETRIRYSSALGYNTFPFPNIKETEKSLITEHVLNVLDEREKYPNKTLSELYDPETMPIGLRQAHGFLDEVIERLYQKRAFQSDEERMACLFKFYKDMLANENIV